jgi:uncharacterized protein YbjT (DUF2867 family)
MRVLITGASGFIGSQLLPRLQRDGHELRVLARDPSRLRIPPAWQVQTVQSDVLYEVGLARALEGIEVAYYLIHSMESGPAVHSTETASATYSKESVSTEGFPARERRAAENFTAAAQRAGVRRIVYLGGPLPATQKADDPPTHKANPPTQKANAISPHLASRLQVERILLEGVPESVALRAAIVIGAGSRSFRFMVRLVERLPVLTLPTWRRYRSQPIDIRDVTEMLAAAASEPDVAGRALDIGGPDILSYGEMIERIAELMLLARPALPLRVSLTPITARVAAALAAEDPQLILPLMESLSCDLLPGDDRAAELLGVHLHSFDAAVERALADWEAVEPLAAR